MDSVEYNEMKGKINIAYSQFMSSLDKQIIVLGEMNVITEKVSEEISTMRQIMENGQETDIVEMVKESISIVPKLQKLDEQFHSEVEKAVQNYENLSASHD